MASKGELVVPEWLVKSGAVNHLRGKIPGFAGGGPVGAIIGAEGQVGRAEADFGSAAVQAFAQSALSAERTVAANQLARAKAQAAANAAAGLNNLPLGTGPHSGSAALAQAFARSILFAYGWGQNQWPFEQALWNQESGWNSYAVNPSSGAYGIPQALGHGHPYNLGDYQAQIRWGDSYIWARYGTPANAWAHERAFNWYDNGGWLKPGMNHMYNGTGGWEHLTPDSGGGAVSLEVSSSGQTAFEHFMVMAIREWVVRKGGGNVQKAFGIPGK
jgi:hypothetical protein